MKYILGPFLFLLVGATTVQAYDLLVTEIDRPYDVVQIAGDEHDKRVYLGELNNFPVMYEISSDEKFELSLQLAEVFRGSETTDFSLMVVRQNDDNGGVTEVVRQMANDNEWTIKKDSVFGLTFLEGKALKKELEPGTYRIEVSTPVNQGKFMLTIGSELDSSGYLKTIGHVWTVQDYFGYSFLKILTSSYVYYPLGILLILFAFYRTWKFRNSISHVA